MRFSTERINVTEIPNSYRVEEAIHLAVSTGNSLLLDYCKEYLNFHGRPLVDDPASYIDEVGNLRWLDTVLTENDETMGREELLWGKIVRTSRQIESLQKGDGYIAYVAVPALNEQESLPAIMESFAGQVTNAPVVFVVADNNSTDKTAEVTAQRDGNSIPAPEPGIGPARQTALDTILADVSHHPANAIIIQTDADCVAESGYVESVVQGFKNNRDAHIGVGPSVYTFPFEDGRTIELSSGKDYRNLLGTVGIKDYFMELSREAGDYLLEPPFVYIIGPNTSFRATTFVDHPSVGYPKGNLWESLHLSVTLQQNLPSSSAIARIEGQRMHVSPRAILKDQPALTQERLQEIRDNRYVGVYTGKGTKSPFESMSIIVDECDAKIYDGILKPHQKIAGVVAEHDPKTREYPTLPALHGATGEHIMGKVALVIDNLPNKPKKY